MKGEQGRGGGGQPRGSLWEPEVAPKPALEVASKPKPKGTVGVEVGRERAQGRARGIPSLPQKKEGVLPSPHRQGPSSFFLHSPGV